MKRFLFVAKNEWLFCVEKAIKPTDGQTDRQTKYSFIVYNLSNGMK